MPRTRSKTMKDAIAKYWLGTDEGLARLPQNAALIDVGEPSCFACGWMAADCMAEPVLWRVWREASLERCHLVPHALGGADAPENLVLLCGRCHREAPDVGDANYMLRWITSVEPWGRRLHRELNLAIESAGVGDELIERFNELFLDRGMNSLKEAMASWAVPVANSFSYATLAACAVEAIVRTCEASDRGNYGHGASRAGDRGTRPARG